MPITPPVPESGTFNTVVEGAVAAITEAHRALAAMAYAQLSR